MPGKDVDRAAIAEIGERNLDLHQPPERAENLDTQTHQLRVTFIQQPVGGGSVVPGSKIQPCFQRRETPIYLSEAKVVDISCLESHHPPALHTSSQAELFLGQACTVSEEASEPRDAIPVHSVDHRPRWLSGAYRPEQYWLAKLRAMIDLSGKAAVVTGGSRGIGRAIVLQLAEQGADVAFSFRGNADAAAEVVELVKQKGRKALSVQGDASDPASAEALVKAALDEFGKVDILVNNAGITRDDLIMRMTPDDFRDVLETNLFGAFYAIKAVTRPMLRAKSGRIVNITSVSGQAGQMGQANYSSAKAGLIGLTKATARELASRGITCNAVAPGMVDTELTSGLSDDLKAMAIDRTPLARFGTTEEIAYAVAFLVSDEAAFITGQVLAVDGGLVMM
jgi:3-oxoacyl-[acyl-carrier protein] reductase